MDTVRLLGVACSVHVGVPEKERARRQKILIDLELEADVSQAGLKDDFRLAVDYWAVERAVRETAQAKPWVLVEAVAERIAAAVLSRFPLVRAVRVAVHKKPAVMPKTRDVVVEVLRRRD